MYIGIDLGGTNIAVGLVDENNKIVAQDSTPTMAEREYKEIVKDMAILCKKVTEEAGYTMDDVLGIGIGSPIGADTIGKCSFTKGCEDGFCLQICSIIVGDSPDGGI